MAKDEQKANDEEGKQTNNYVKFSGMAFQMVFIIGLFTFGGYKIDQAANHDVKWVTAAFSLTGVFISLYIVIRSLKD